MRFWGRFDNCNNCGTIGPVPILASEDDQLLRQEWYFARDRIAHEFG